MNERAPGWEVWPHSCPSRPRPESPSTCWATASSVGGLTFACRRAGSCEGACVCPQHPRRHDLKFHPEPPGVAHATQENPSRACWGEGGGLLANLICEPQMGFSIPSHGQRGKVATGWGQAREACGHGATRPAALSTGLGLGHQESGPQGHALAPAKLPTHPGRPPPDAAGEGGVWPLLPSASQLSLEAAGFRGKEAGGP